jgi:hypothetical protein
MPSSIFVAIAIFFGLWIFDREAPHIAEAL